MLLNPNTAFLDALHSASSSSTQWAMGVEKEGLRIHPDGTLSQSPHFEGLGSKLCHPHITTDYAENLLELITPPVHSFDELDQWLSNLHHFTQSNIDDELIWPCSMPGNLPSDNEIPIAYYGTSNSGRMKSIYRQGLALRYGKVMQMIAGVHFNASYPDHWLALAADHFKAPGSEIHFHIIRNFIRMQSLLLLLCGASPAVDRSLFGDKPIPHGMESLQRSTLFLPYATSLRMSDLGYTNVEQDIIQLTFNSLDEYTSALYRAVSLSHPPYEAIGLLDQFGDYQQLTTAFLQVENEHYCSIRPKQVSKRGERPLCALKQRGVRYLEVRLLDLDPFHPLGINEDAMALCQMVLLHCLISDSPAMTINEKRQLDAFALTVAREGRDPSLTIAKTLSDNPMTFHEWARRTLEALQPTAALLNSLSKEHDYSQTLKRSLEQLNDTNLLPSSRYLNMLTEQHLDHRDLGLKLAQSHRAKHLDLELSQATIESFAQLKVQSVEDQQALENNDTKTFSEYLDNYLLAPCSKLVDN